VKNSKDLLIGDNLPFIEDLYSQYVTDPESVDPSWRPLFEEYFGAIPNGHASGRVHPGFLPRSLFEPIHGESDGMGVFSEAEYNDEDDKESSVKTPSKSAKFAARVAALVRAYRLRGHLVAELDPLGRERKNLPPSLDPAHHGFSDNDLKVPLFYESLFGARQVTLGELIDRLKHLYCKHVAVEFWDIPQAERRLWLKSQIELNDYSPLDGMKEKTRIYEQLCDADAFEMFLHKKYIGAKRFGITGGDALIPLFHAMLDEGAKLGLQEVIIGMAHRGRLNVLRNIMGKPAEVMLSEFEKAPDPESALGASDVKYHMGYSSDYKTIDGQSVHLSLSFNPSHLEFVNPVVVGRVRAKQDIDGSAERKTKFAPFLLHGDAAFSGQGIVTETLNLAKLEAHDVGGTIHIVINNQVGFTAIPEESRSTTYCTDIAKILEIPIFHINSDDPEACVRVAKLAMRYRQKFKTDIVIDFICYRRYGHNEGDEPRFTQPTMYKAIDALDPIRVQYGNTLIAEKVLTDAEVKEKWDSRLASYAQTFEKIRKNPIRPDVCSMLGRWTNYRGGMIGDDKVETRVSTEILTDLGDKMTTLDASIKVHRTVKRLFATRKKMISGQQSLDWGAAEGLAFATLISEGCPIRLCGQDVVRGTFGHRHAAVYNSENDEKFWPMENIDGASFDVFNSCLSEQGVLGYEYGYSLDKPETLTIWEAQFGDFSNGAQIIIDQFISSGEDKWKRLSGIVMLLPHGYEGQGPEHSSARIERYLQLCAEDNMFVCNFTLPSQYFHALRRHMLSKVRKPLLVMTPKSLLRYKHATSELSELSEGEFQKLIPEVRELDADKVKRVIFCSGKVYYDLYEAALEQEREDVAIIRVEQLFPLNTDDLKNEITKYKNAEVFWVQEEPKNMGPWSYIFPLLIEAMDEKKIPKYIGRPASASPATGVKEAHLIEQKMIVDEAIRDL